MSFKMIFSIILIIAFVALAIYVITIFMSISKCVNTGLFKEELQSSIDTAWASDSYEETLSITLESGLDVCFTDSRVNINMFFDPVEDACSGQEEFNIRHLNISEITRSENPYCIENANGEIEIRIEKGFSDVLVRIRRID